MTALESPAQMQTGPDAYWEAELSEFVHLTGVTIVTKASGTPPVTPIVDVFIGDGTRKCAGSVRLVEGQPNLISCTGYAKKLRIKGADLALCSVTPNGHFAPSSTSNTAWVSEAAVLRAIHCGADAMRMYLHCCSKRAATAAY